MANISAIGKFVTRGIGKTTLFLNKHKSEILTGAGLIGSTAGTILACKATTKLESTLEKAKCQIDDIRATKDSCTDKEYGKDLTKAYISAAGDIAKLYAVPTALIVLSDAAIIGGHVALRKENIALTGAYMALSKSYEAYRKRVVADAGKEKDIEYMHGLKKEEVGTVKDEETGEETPAHAYTVNGNTVSIYARYFDEKNPNWNRNQNWNVRFLKMVQNTANDKLHTKGHLFLNEVYDMLGIERSLAGNIVGWIDGEGDSYVDFGVYDISDPDKRAYINGYGDAVLLDFNVDGPILHYFNGESEENLKTFDLDKELEPGTLSNR